MPRFYSLAPKSISGALAATLLLSTSSISLALDAQSIVNRVQQLAASQGQQITYEAIENESDDGFSLKGVAMTISGSDPIKIDNVALSGISEGAGGSLSIGSMIYNQISFANKDVSISLDNAAFKDFYVPAEGETDALKSMGYYASFAASNMKIVAQGNEVGSFTTALVTVDPFTRDQPIAMNGTISGIRADLTSVDDPQFKGVMGQLGYDGKFSGGIVLGGSWNAADGRMEISKYDISIDNIGTLGISLAINGYTAELAQRMQKANKMATENSDAQAATQAMMAELPNLKLENATVSFTDDSVTKRVLTFQGKQMGSSADDMAKMVPTMLPMMMAGLGNPDFTTMVAGAVGRFLGAPGNITITAKPGKPLPFSELMGIGMAAPQTLPDALAVKVTANE